LNAEILTADSHLPPRPRVPVREHLHPLPAAPRQLAPSPLDRWVIHSKISIPARDSIMLIAGVCDRRVCLYVHTTCSDPHPLPRPQAPVRERLRPAAPAIASDSIAACSARRGRWSDACTAAPRQQTALPPNRWVIHWETSIPARDVPMLITRTQALRVCLNDEILNADYQSSPAPVAVRGGYLHRPPISILLSPQRFAGGGCPGAASTAPERVPRGSSSWNESSGSKNWTKPHRSGVCA